MTNKKRKLLYIRLKNNIRTHRATVYYKYKFSNEILKDDLSIIEAEEHEAKSKAEKYWRLPLKLIDTQTGIVDMDFANDLTTVNFIYEHSRD